MCRSMVDIQSVAAEIRRGKKEEEEEDRREKKETTGQKYNAPPLHRAAIKTVYILMKQEMTGWQWHQLDHMQIIYTSLLTDNHTST